MHGCTATDTHLSRTTCGDAGTRDDAFRLDVVEPERSSSTAHHDTREDAGEDGIEEWIPQKVVNSLLIGAHHPNH